MTKKTKKAAKPRPKTVTLRQWRIYFHTIGVVSLMTFKTRSEAMAEGIHKIGHRDWRAARVTITYEVRR